MSFYILQSKALDANKYATKKTIAQGMLVTQQNFSSLY